MVEAKAKNLARGPELGRAATPLRCHGNRGGAHPTIEPGGDASRVFFAGAKRAEIPGAAQREVESNLL